MARRIRKSVADLTWDDLDAHPAWEYALDEEGRRGQDETTVRPVALPLSPRMPGPLIVAAVFTFPNGRVRMGSVQWDGGSGDDLAATHPVLLLPDGPLHFYHGALEPSRAGMKSMARRLKAVSQPSLPIDYVATLRDRKGEPLVEGTLKGVGVWGGFGKRARILRLP